MEAVIQGYRIVRIYGELLDDSGPRDAVLDAIQHVLFVREGLSDADVRRAVVKGQHQLPKADVG